MVLNVTCTHNNSNSLSLCSPIYLVIYLLDAGSGSVLFSSLLHLFYPTAVYFDGVTPDLDLCI